jgi:glycosyltransferase involved in cell wall biosynthesis
MISFIVIGRNEGWKLKKCLESIALTVEQDGVAEHEIIYVDSASTDNSLSIAKEFEGVKVVLLTGNCSPAIARNVGVTLSTGNILYFIDGDMEILPDFLPQVLRKDYTLIYPFVSGFYYNYNYNSNWEIRSQTQHPPAKKLKPFQYEIGNGGLAIMARETWNSVGGMKNYMRKGEDPDLGFRLAKRGVLKLRINRPMAIHHTQKYEGRKSFGSLLLKSNLIGTVLLYRENILSFYGLKFIITREASFVALVLSLLLFVLTQHYLALAPYLAIQIVRTFRRFAPLRFPYIVFKDLVLLFGFLFFYPSKEVKVSYSVIA